MPDYDRLRPEPAARAAPATCTLLSSGGIGNAATQDRLPSDESIDPPRDCDQDDLAEAMARDAFFATSFTQPDFQPSTGFGRFDASYEPASGVLDIVLRLAFDFTLPEGASASERLMAALTGETGWDTSKREAFIEQYKQVVESTWSGAHALQCVRPGWDEVVATPRLRIEVVDPAAGNPHYIVTVHGASTGMERDDQRPRVGAPGPFGGPGEAEMDHDDFASRPLGNAVVRDEIARIEALLPASGVRVEDDGAAARIPNDEVARLREIADGLALSERYPSGPQLRLEAVGWAKEPLEYPASHRGRSINPGGRAWCVVRR